MSTEKEKEIVLLKRGADTGNSFSKFFNGEKGIRLLSSIEKITDKKHFTDSTSYDVFYEGEHYLVGGNDSPKITGIDKIYTKEYEVLLLTGLISSLTDTEKNIKDINFEIGIGTPAEDFDKYKEIYENKTLSFKDKEITVNDMTYNISISKSKALPQCGAILDLEKNKFPALVFDFGGGTLDVSSWRIDENGFLSEVYLKTCDTLGFDKILKDFKYEIKSQLDYRSLIHLLDNPVGQSVKKSGKYDHTETINKLLNIYSQSLSTQLNEVPYDGIKTICFTGGCAEFMLETVCDTLDIDNNMVEIPSIPQFANAKMYFNYIES